MTKRTQPKRSAEKSVCDIRRATWRHYSAEEKIRIVLEGLRGDSCITLGRRGYNSDEPKCLLNQAAKSLACFDGVH